MTHHNLKNLIGQRFGRLLVTGISPVRGKRKEVVWECLCDCGNKHFVTTSNIHSKGLKSCGCYVREIFAKNQVPTHGLTRERPRPYRIWSGMRQRCNDQKNKDYPNYGGRGIKICPEWDDYLTFWEDMKEGYSDQLTIDRIDNMKGYSKDNCKWSTTKQQINNTRVNRLVTYKGETTTTTLWAEKIGMSSALLRYRLDSGYSVEEAIETPIIKYNINQ